jgi:hypothetical protein
VTLVLLMAASAACAPATVQEPAPPVGPTPKASPRAGFVPGEAIVKFKPASEAGRESRSPQDADPKAAFEALAARLSRETGWPLEVRRAMSGGELLVAIRFETLAQRLLEQAREEARLKDVAIEVAPPGEGPSLPTLRGRLATKEADPAALARQLGARVGFPVTARSESQGEIRLSVDVAAATARLVETLKQRPDVEYAQPNYILKKLGDQPRAAPHQPSCFGLPGFSPGGTASPFSSRTLRSLRMPRRTSISSSNLW